jgi:CheY-like chemotaxis protein
MDAKPARYRIVMLDDDPDARAPFAMFLRLRGFRVDEFDAPEEALASMAGDAPAVVVMDITLSAGIDGYEAARRIRAAQWGGSVRLIAMTGYSSTAVKREGALFDTILTKPVNPEELAALVQRFCSDRD